MLTLYMCWLSSGEKENILEWLLFCSLTSSPSGLAFDCISLWFFPECTSVPLPPFVTASLLHLIILSAENKNKSFNLRISVCVYFCLCYIMRTEFFTSTARTSLESRDILALHRKFTEVVEGWDTLWLARVKLWTRTATINNEIQNKSLMSKCLQKPLLISITLKKCLFLTVWIKA